MINLSPPAIESMNTDDPSATYRGYRRQAVYALFRLFDDGLPDGWVIQPEGYEDLAIYDVAGSLIEIVQVKDHSDNLTASSFKPSFYERIAPRCVPGSTTTVRIVSYGPIGPDLQNALSGDAAALSRVLKTLTKYRAQAQQKETISEELETEARNIIKHIQLTPVVEEILTDAIVAALSKTITGVNGRQAFEFLMWWLLTSSEVKLKIDRSKAIAKIERIGKFLSQRAAYHDEWHTTIVPIVPSSGDTASTTEFTEEFYRGGRVRFDHVNMDLDVSRDRILKSIHEAFGRNNVVVIHSASGQGKTTLAYRYAKEFAASDFRLEVLTPSDLKHARRVALALIGHAEAIEVPTLILLDVRPGDTYWVEVVRELASVIGIRILVSIREEDWTRARISAADFSFAQVQLSLEKEEAEAIYDRLRDKTVVSRHLDFEDAWSQFGARKTLFEFVYYVTQEESLADRISSQIEALQDAVIQGNRAKGELELLKLVSVASAYEARLHLTELLHLCRIDAPQRTIQLFNNEYLIRVSEDGSIVEGYHSVRSEIIASKLIDPVLNSWSEAVSRILPMIVEDDLYAFLLCTFSRNQNASQSVIAALHEVHPKTWVGIQSVAMALMWNGVKQYSDQNASLLEEVFQQAGAGWYLTLDWDLAQVCGKDGINVFDELERVVPRLAAKADYARSARARQSDKDSVFFYMRRWLEGYTEQPMFPDNMRNFNAMGELLFWLGHLQINSSLRGLTSKTVIDKARKDLPLYSFGEFARGIRTCASEAYAEWLDTSRESVINDLRQEAAIIKLEETEESVVAHYVIDLDRQSSVLRSRGDSSKAAEATIHDLSLERVELLSNLFPGKKQYGAVGYGHQVSLFEQPCDDANKPGVLSENLHSRWLTRFNALSHGYVELRFRPKSWADYFELLQSVREKVLAALGDLRQSITTGTHTLKRATEWEECRREINKLFIPRVAVDEWGFITESSTAATADPQLDRYSGLNRVRPISQAVAEYTTKVESFLSQAVDCLLLVPLLRDTESQAARELLMANASKIGINETSIRMSIINAIDACVAVEQLQRASRRVFGSEQLPGADLQFCERERKEFLSTITAWCMFTDADTRKQVAERLPLSKSQSQRRKLQSETEVSDFLLRTRHRVKQALKQLRKLGINAQLHSETVLWNSKPALWITCDTVHPVATPYAIEVVWHQLVDAFSPDRQKIVRLKAMDLLWPSIIILPLVAGKSLERHGLPHFKAVTYMDPPDLERNSWHLFPEQITEDVWQHLKLDCWEQQPSWSIFDRYTAAYGSLIQHIEHMSDFGRLPCDIDDLGASILQSYLEREIIRAQPLLQEVFDSCAAVLSQLPEGDHHTMESRPNIFLCTQVLVKMNEAILPSPNFQGQGNLTIDQIRNWRDRLVAGLFQLGMARCLWIADSLNFDEPNFSD